jgi:hypothetical protein
MPADTTFRKLSMSRIPSAAASTASVAPRNENSMSPKSGLTPASKISLSI